MLHGQNVNEIFELHLLSWSCSNSACSSAIPRLLSLKQPEGSPDQSQKVGVMKLQPSTVTLPTGWSLPSGALASIHHAPIIPAFGDEVLKFTVLRPGGLARLLLQISYVSSITPRRP